MLVSPKNKQFCSISVIKIAYSDLAFKPIDMLRYFQFGMRPNSPTTAKPSTRLNWEFYVVLTGECAPVFDQFKKQDLKSHTLWIIPPTLSYGWAGSPDGWERILFHFSFIPDTLRSYIPEGSFIEIALSDAELDTIRQLARQVEPYIASPNELSNLMFHRTLIDLSLIVLKKIPVKKVDCLDDIRFERVERAISWYNDNMQKAPTIEAVAAAVSISASHLRRHFQQIKCISPNKHFQKMRMVRASKLLSKSTETLDQVSRACGYPNSSDFCRAFRKHFGSTPHIWRTRIIPKEPFREDHAPVSDIIATNMHEFIHTGGRSKRSDK